MMRTYLDQPLANERAFHSLPATGLKDEFGAPLNLPNHIVQELTKLPKLTREQCGHLRHFHNLASQPDGDWSFMGGATGQEHDEGSYRYQLAFMAYAAGVAHYHRLPALRSVFRGLLQRLIKKMLHPDVWGYWYMASQSGKKLDPDLKELRKPWADPVCKENVMYSGHLLLMVSLYSMLFNDDQYDQEDSIVFDWNPIFWGMGPEKYSYTRTTLQVTILEQMERSGWMGVCCEPNTIFIICNQFPIIATRYNDVHNSTHIVGTVLAKYKEAWAKRGMLSENGLFRKWYSVRQDHIADSQDIAHSAWVMAFMPWNTAQVKSMYPTVGTGFLEHTPDNRINIRPPALANEIRRLTTTSTTTPESPTLLAQAHSNLQHTPPTPTSTVPLPTFGFVSQWLSEIAGPADLDPLLHHADQYLNPTWTKDGGLYYARNDTLWDNVGNYVHMEPYSGNAAIGYARLNVQYGQIGMFERPWTREEVDARPCVEGVGLECGIDFLRGIWVEGIRAVVVTGRRWEMEGKEVDVELVVRMLPRGRWGVYIEGRLSGVHVIEDGEDVSFGVKIGGEEVDVVVVDLDGM